MKNILIAGDLYQDDTDIESAFQENIRTEIVHLETGKILPPSEYNDDLNPEKFDMIKLARDSQYGEVVPGDQDMAQIRRKSKYMRIYKVVRDSQTVKIIFPVYGNGGKDPGAFAELGPLQVPDRENLAGESDWTETRHKSGST